MTRQFCWKCGTKLLITSGAPPSDAPMSFMDEHVLERISAMEYALSAATKKLDSLGETLERVAANNFIDHTMLETLTESLESAGINLANLEEDWRKRVDSRLVENEEIDRLGERVERIIESYRGTDRRQFTMWMERAYEKLVTGRPTEGLTSLQAGFEHDPSNHELGMLLAEVHFQARDFTAATECLTQVLQTKPDSFEATLLMGLLQRRHGNLNEAERFLEASVRIKGDSPSAHVTLGSLFLERGNRLRALTHLNKALELKPSAPAHFMLGAVCYQDGRHRRAIDHLKQATELDPQFDEAFYQLGLVCLEMNWRRKAQECFKHAQQLNPRERRYHQKGRGFEEGLGAPEQLSGLVREELHLTARWNDKR